MTPRVILTLLLLLVLVAFLGCDNDSSNDITDTGSTDKSCIGCHSSEDALKEILGDEKVVVAIGNKDDG